MTIENIQLLIFASALILITLNILVCSFSASHSKYRVAGIWLIRATAIIPGFLAVCGGLYIWCIENNASVGWALFSAGMLLEMGGLLLSGILRKRISPPAKAH